MAKGNKTGGRNFQPGNKFGKGATSHNPALKALRRMSQADIAEVGQLILESNVEELEKLKGDPTTTSLKVMLCAIALKAVRNGDSWAMDSILNRIIGKPKEHVQLTGADDGPVHVVNTIEVKEIVTKLENDY